MSSITNLSTLAKLVRYYILTSTTAAGSGHPTSSLSATDIMTVLMFGGFFKADLENPEFQNNDRLIFSKGHASPLFYSLYAVAGKISKNEMLKLRQFDSPLEGHPTMRFPYTEAATGSLGQGLSVGLGMALNAKMEGLDYNTYVLMGDSEMSEGSIWEGMHLGNHYNLNNLVGIIDINRLGQRGETMYGHDVEDYRKKCEAFGWETFVIDGHNLKEIRDTFEKINNDKYKPKMIIAKTFKGAGISFLKDKEGWHGKTLSLEEMDTAIAELGSIDMNIKGVVKLPNKDNNNDHKKNQNSQNKTKKYSTGEKVSTRKAYGNSLIEVGSKNQQVVVLDAETSNSTFAIDFKNCFPNRFFEMYIAEQNMVSTALGFSRRGKIPFVSTFAAFFTRAFDQIRMSQYSNSNIKFVGSHAGVSIGEDGSSQMALEDIAMMRSISDIVVLYPSDANSTHALVNLATNHQGNVYIRTTRAETEVIYDTDTEFKIGGSNTIYSSQHDEVTVIGAGITLQEAIKAYHILSKKYISIRVIDLYSIKPLDVETIRKACVETKAIIVVEDHRKEGGIYEAIYGSGVVTVHMQSLSVYKMPRSGTPSELMKYEEIDAEAIVARILNILNR